MDIISRQLTKTAPPPSLQPPDLLSLQVSETAYFFLNLHPSRRIDFAISAGGRERCDPDYVVRRRKYGYTVIEFVAEGRGRVTLNGRTFPLKAGTLFAYRPDTACEILTDAAQRLVKYFICLSGGSAPRRLSEAGLQPGKAFHLPAHMEIQSLFAQLIHEGQVRAKFSGESCGLLLQLLLLKIRECRIRRPRRSPPGFEKFTQIKQLIDDDAAQFGTLRELARQTGVSPVATCKLFRQHLGLSPFRYLTRRKMEIAAEHLVRESLLVKEAAARVGFRDPCHFSRRFKQHYGLSPLAMRSGWRS